MKQKLQEISSSSFNLIIFGEALIDDFPNESVVGGAPFNVARGLALLGGRPLIVTRLGNDANGRLILSEGLRTGLDGVGIQIDSQYPTGRVVVHMKEVDDPSSHSFEILPEQAYDFIDQVQTLNVVRQHFVEAAPDLIYFGSMIQRNASSRHALLALLEADCCEGATKFLDLNLREGQTTIACIRESLNYADILKLNEDELRFVLRYALDQPYMEELVLDSNSLQLACESLLKVYLIQAVIVTLGRHGYFYIDAEGRVVTSLNNETSVNVVDWVLQDTVGAGDAFSASFIRGWQQNQPLKKILDDANRFAHAICGVRGAVAADVKFYSPWRL